MLNVFRWSKVDDADCFNRYNQFTSTGQWDVEREPSDPRDRRRALSTYSSTRHYPWCVCPFEPMEHGTTNIFSVFLLPIKPNKFVLFCRSVKMNFTKEKTACCELLVVEKHVTYQLGFCSSDTTRCHTSLDEPLPTYIKPATKRVGCYVYVHKTHRDCPWCCARRVRSTNAAGKQRWHINIYRIIPWRHGLW